MLDQANFAMDKIPLVARFENLFCEILRRRCHGRNAIFESLKVDLAGRI